MRHSLQGTLPESSTPTTWKHTFRETVLSSILGEGLLVRLHWIARRDFNAQPASRAMLIRPSHVDALAAYAGLPDYLLQPLRTLTDWSSDAIGSQAGFYQDRLDHLREFLAGSTLQPHSGVATFQDYLQVPPACAVPWTLFPAAPAGNSHRGAGFSFAVGPAAAFGRPTYRLRNPASAAGQRSGRHLLRRAAPARTLQEQGGCSCPRPGRPGVLQAYAAAFKHERLATDAKDLLSQERQAALPGQLIARLRAGPSTPSHL